MTVEKQKEIDLALATINKRFGAGSVFTGNSEALDVSVISTGNFSLDNALGVGGLPRGRMTEIFGDEATGKTLLCLTTIAEAQKAGGIVAMIDVEHAFDPAWALFQGVDVDALVISQPSSAEEALQILDALVDTGSFDLIVLDSVGALVAQAEVEGNIGDAHVAQVARLMAQALRKINPKLEKSKTMLIFVNQQYMGIGPMASKTTSGGRKLKYYASVRIELVNKGQLTNSAQEKIGNKITAKVIKNKVAPPFRQAHYEVLAGIGFDNNRMILAAADKHGLVKRNKSYYYAVDEDGVIADKSFANGDAQGSAYLKENPEYKTMLQTKVLEKLKK